MPAIKEVQYSILIGATYALLTAKISERDRNSLIHLLNIEFVGLTTFVNLMIFNGLPKAVKICSVANFCLPYSQVGLGRSIGKGASNDPSNTVLLERNIRFIPLSIIRFARCVTPSTLIVRVPFGSFSQLVMDVIPPQMIAWLTLSNVLAPTFCSGRDKSRNGRVEQSISGRRVVERTDQPAVCNFRVKNLPMNPSPPTIKTEGRVSVMTYQVEGNSANPAAQNN